MILHLHKNREAISCWSLLPAVKFALIILPISICVFAGIAEASPTSSGEARSRPALPQGQSVPVHLAVDISAGRISVKMDNVPLAKLLAIVAERTRARVVVHGTADENLNVEFHDLPLEEGLRRIVHGKNVAFFYESRISTGRVTARLFEMRIFSGGDDGTQATVFDPISPVVSRLGPRAKVSADQTQANPILGALTKRLREATGAQERKDAAVALGKLTDPAAIESLSQALSADVESSVRIAAAEALAKTWDESAVAPLSRSLVSDGTSAVREAAARALGLTWSENAISPLIEALSTDRDALVREQAARALGQTAGDEAVPALAHALAQDPRVFVRDAAAQALGTIGGQDALDALARASVADGDEWVRETAAISAVNSPK